MHKELLLELAIGRLFFHFFLQDEGVSSCLIVMFACHQIIFAKKYNMLNLY